MRPQKGLYHLFILPLLLVQASVPFAGETLSRDEVETLFTDKTFEGIHLNNGWTFKNYAGKDGRCKVLFLTGKKSGQTRSYRWFVKENMHFCDTGRRHICGTITDEGDGVYFKHRNGKKHIQTFMNFVEGKQI